MTLSIKEEAPFLEWMRDSSELPRDKEVKDFKREVKEELDDFETSDAESNAGIDTNSKTKQTSDEENFPVNGREFGNDGKKVSSLPKIAIQRTKGETKDLVNACTDISASIGNKCQFTCPFCQIDLNNWHGVKKHCLKLHKGQNIPKVKFFSKIVCHVCNICSMKVICDYRFLHGHMYYHHGLTVKAYSNKCLVGNDCKQFKDTTLVAKALISKSSETTDLVGSLCIFECAHCKATFQSLGTLYQHEARFEHRHDKLDQAVVKAAHHVCRVCGDKVVSDSLYLSSHMKKHKMKISDYAKRFGLELTGPDIKRQNNKASILKSIKLTNEIGNLCVLACNVCNNVFKSVSAINCHFKKTMHNKVCYTSHLIMKFMQTCLGHQCKLCGQIMICDDVFIFSHLRKKHGFTKAKYKKHFGLTTERHYCELEQRDKYLKKKSVLSTVLVNKCTFKCTECPQKCTSWKQMINHLSDSHTGQHTRVRALQACDAKSTVYYYKCKICQTETLCDKKVFGEHLRANHKGVRLATYLHEHEQVSKLISINQIGNMCRYTCSDCNFEFNKSAALKNHLKVTGHAKNVVDPSKKLMTSRAIHTCKICMVPLKCEIAVLTGHFLYAHGITLRNYATKFSVQYQSVAHKTLYRDVLKRFVKNVKHFNQGQMKMILTDQGACQPATRSIGSLSTLKCPECGVDDFLSWKSLSSHREKVHDKDKSFSPKYVSQPIYHSCLLCRRHILCDPTFLLRHLRSNHKEVTYNQYKNWVKVVGGVCFPSKDEFCAQQDDPAYLNSMKSLGEKHCVVRLNKLRFL